jgi:hypothetical protein
MGKRFEGQWITLRREGKGVIPARGGSWDNAIRLEESRPPGE